MRVYYTFAADLYLVNQPKHPLRINVGFLLHAPYGYSRDIHFDYPGLKLDDLEVSGFSGLARVSRTPQGILVQAEFSGSAKADCVRCLAAFLQPLHTAFDELYAFDGRSTTESDLILPDDANIDLAPLARDYLLLEMPISPICRSDCKGLCPECGTDWNLETCEHASSVPE